MRERLLAWLETFGDHIARHGWYDPSGMGMGPDPAILAGGDSGGEDRRHGDDGGSDPGDDPRPEPVAGPTELIAV